MKRLSLVLVFLLAASAVFAQAQNEASAEPPKKTSLYKKATRLVDGIAKAVKPAAEKALEAVVDNAEQSLKDFADDINAPEEEQSGFAKFFNFICDVDVDENLKNSGACYNGPVEEVPEGIF